MSFIPKSFLTGGGATQPTPEKKDLEVRVTVFEAELKKQAAINADLLKRVTALETPVVASTEDEEEEEEIVF